MLRFGDVSPRSRRFLSCFLGRGARKQMLPNRNSGWMRRLGNLVASVELVWSNVIFRGRAANGARRVIAEKRGKTTREGGIASSEGRRQREGKEGRQRVGGKGR